MTTSKHDFVAGDTVFTLNVKDHPELSYKEATVISWCPSFRDWLVRLHVDEIDGHGVNRVFYDNELKKVIG